jgi:hypothetical protein
VWRRCLSSRTRLNVTMAPTNVSQTPNQTLSVCVPQCPPRNRPGGSASVMKLTITNAPAATKPRSVNKRIRRGDQFLALAARPVRSGGSELRAAPTKIASAPASERRCGRYANTSSLSQPRSRGPAFTNHARAGTRLLWSRNREMLNTMPTIGVNFVGWNAVEGCMPSLASPSAPALTQRAGFLVTCWRRSPYWLYSPLRGSESGR